MSRILIANRGEIAVRVIRACAQNGHTSIAVYADQDANALHAQLADVAIALPGTTAAETYLSIEAIIAAARRAGADAVHPGYRQRRRSTHQGELSPRPTCFAARSLGWRCESRILPGQSAHRSPHRR